MLPIIKYTTERGIQHIHGENLTQEQIDTLLHDIEHNGGTILRKKIIKKEGRDYGNPKRWRYFQL